MRATPVRATSLADAVYQRLRDDILLGRLRPNELLVEGDLAERLDVSRTPVRESLQRLAKDGLIASHRRRWFVVEHTLDQIRENYEVRAALEGYAARLATERATPEQLDRIGRALEERANASGDEEGMVVANEAFHRLVIEAAGNARLAEAIERSKLYYFNSQLASLYTPADTAASQAQHVALFEALRSRDGDAAERVTREHIYRAFELIASWRRP